jgi:hypothetical protein
MDPRYQELASRDIPRATVPGGWVKVLSGNFAATDAAIDTRIPIQYLHVHLDADRADADGGITVAIPADHNGFAYVLGGRARIDGEIVRAGQIIRLGPGGRSVARAERAVGTDASADALDVIVLSGKPLREPVARYGPFVMNTRDEIYQAVRDFQEGRFGTIPAAAGGRTPYLPGRDEPQ